NTPPFRLEWDTSKFPNGQHRIEITVYDRQGRVIDQAIKEIRTANAGAPKHAVDGPRIEAVRSAIWQMLVLRPSRALLAYEAAQCARAMGNSVDAVRYFRQSAAVSPHFRDARTQLAVIEGSISEVALWRGAPSEKAVALTFDDGPKPGITDQLLAILSRENVP